MHGSDEGSLVSVWINKLKADAAMAVGHVVDTPAEARVLVTVVHQAKGLEWDNVQLANDFDEAGLEKLHFASADRARYHALLKVARALSAPPAGHDVGGWRRVADAHMRRVKEELAELAQRMDKKMVAKPGEADDVPETVCLLNVAATRARTRLYMNSSLAFAMTRVNPFSHAWPCAAAGDSALLTRSRRALRKGGRASVGGQSDVVDLTQL
jgi:superfamily I DNA/RNA helicase